MRVQLPRGASASHPERLLGLKPLKLRAFSFWREQKKSSLKGPTFGFSKLILLGNNRHPAGLLHDSRPKRFPSSNDSGRRRCSAPVAGPRDRHSAVPARPRGSARWLRRRGALGRGRRPVEQSGYANKQDYDSQ